MPIDENLFNVDTLDLTFWEDEYLQRKAVDPKTHAINVYYDLNYNNGKKYLYKTLYFAPNPFLYVDSGIMNAEDYAIVASSDPFVDDITITVEEIFPELTQGQTYKNRDIVRYDGYIVQIQSKNDEFTVPQYAPVRVDDKKIAPYYFTENTPSKFTYTADEIKQIANQAVAVLQPLAYAHSATDVGLYLDEADKDVKDPQNPLPLPKRLGLYDEFVIYMRIANKEYTAQFNFKELSIPQLRLKVCPLSVVKITG